MNPQSIFPKLLLLLIGSILLAIPAFSDIPGVQWQKNFGGSELDHNKWICQTKDGGFIVSGYTRSNNGDVSGNHGTATQQDAWIIKLDAAGKLIWQKTLGGTEDDELTCICESPNGGYVAVGFTRSINGDVTANHGKADLWIVKLTADGEIQWQKTYGGKEDEVANAIQTTTDGGFIVAGYTESSDGDILENHGGRDYWVLKLTASGGLQWEHTYGNAATNTGNSIAQTYDGGYIVTGTSDCISGDLTMSAQHDLRDCWVIKLTATGMVEWERAYGGSKNDIGKNIIQAKDSSYVIAGQTESDDGDINGFHGGPDAWVFCIEQNGMLKWQKPLGGSNVDNARVVIQCKDSGFLIGGSSSSANGNVTGVHHESADYLLVKLAKDGSVSWSKTLGSNNDDYISGLVETANGDYVAAGDVGNNDGDVAFSHGGDDLWIVKLSMSTAILPSVLLEAMRPYPNPCSGTLYLELPQGYDQATLQLYTATGQLALVNNQQRLGRVLNLETLAKGLYFLTVRTSDGVKVFQVLNE